MYTVREVMKMYNILVCDDDKAIVEAIEIYLSQEGYHILKAYDGEQALKILETEEVHPLGWYSTLFQFCGNKTCSRYTQRIIDT